MLTAITSSLWKFIDFDRAYGNQCVDYARWYANEVGNPIWTFWGTAFIWWDTWLPFKGTKWVRVPFNNNVPSAWDIIFFKKNKLNWYCWHVAVVKYADESNLVVAEQNAGDGTWAKTKWNEICIRPKKYTEVLGWFTLN